MTEPLEFPEHFPGAWHHIPLEVRRYLTQRLLEKSLVVHEGPAGLIKFLYAGTERNGQRLSYLTGGAECWAYVVHDTQEWLAAKTARASAGSSMTESV